MDYKGKRKRRQILNDFTLHNEDLLKIITQSCLCCLPLALSEMIVFQKYIRDILIVLLQLWQTFC